MCGVELKVSFHEPRNHVFYQVYSIFNPMNSSDASCEKV